MPPFTTILLDIDGTLVDSNDAHAHAWVEAFAAAGIAADFATVRRCIGMGGDKLIPAVTGIAGDSATAEALSRQRSAIFKEKYLPQVKPFPDAGRLVAALKARGYTCVAASSAKKDELRALLRIAGAESLLDGATSSDDAEESKPEPDIVHAALQQAHADPANGVMIGDTPYDVEAAARAGVAVVGLRCGGWTDEDLRGTVAVFDGPWDLLAQLDRSPLARRPD
jgi:HAD superfamily hydrolase (TIGR01509 family)